jgi:hypothetical protein
MKTSEPFGADVAFPSLSPDAIPEDGAALRAILAGHTALEALYGRLGKACAGESAFLVRLLARDWKRRFAGLAAEAKDLLASLGERKAVEPLPDAEGVERLAARQKGVAPRALADCLSAFASRALLCHQLVPWKSQAPRVAEHFSTCLEAEDEHLAVLDLLLGLLEEENGG